VAHGSQSVEQLGRVQNGQCFQHTIGTCGYDNLPGAME
jgi:hypothetical protein